MVEGIEYEFEVRKKPTFSYIEVALKKGQAIQCEGGTMTFFDPTLEISTKKATKGFLKSLKRMLAGETFFLNTFHALDEECPIERTETKERVQGFLENLLYLDEECLIERTETNTTENIKTAIFGFG